MTISNAVPFNLRNVSTEEIEKVIDKNYFKGLKRVRVGAVWNAKIIATRHKEGKMMLDVTVYPALYYKMTQLHITQYTAQEIQEAKHEATAFADELRGILEATDLELPAVVSPGTAGVAKERPRDSEGIFIVHGRDDENKRILKETLIQWGLNPILLEEKPSKGKTLIEGLIECVPQASFAFVIMTPDDIGTERSAVPKFIETVIDHVQGSPSSVSSYGSYMRTWPSNLPQAIDKAIELCFESRARQNIIFEYGLCIGILQREKVHLLLKGNVSLPSDILGIRHTRFNETVSEDQCKEKIKRELEHAGYKLKSQIVTWSRGPARPDQDRNLLEVADKDLPPNLLAEKRRLNENPHLASPVRVFRGQDGNYVIQWDEI